MCQSLILLTMRLFFVGSSSSDSVVVQDVPLFSSSQNDQGKHSDVQYKKKKKENADVDWIFAQRHTHN